MNPQRLNDFISHYAEHTPDAEAFVHGDRRITYRELQARVDALARALLNVGVRKGDRVAALATPHPDALISLFAATSIGAIWVGLNPRFHREELRHVVLDAEPVVLFARTQIGERSYRSEIDGLRSESPNLSTVVIFGNDPAVAGAQAFERFMATGDAQDPALLEKARAACGGRDPCLLIYTSGSTGKPKGALLHHQGIIAFSREQARAWPVSTARYLNFFPINHIGCVVDISCPALADGGCIVFLEQFSPRESLRLMAKERITLWAAVPSTFQMQLALPDFSSYNLSAVELIVWEGGPMPLETLRALRAITPRLATNYGMTEATSAITIVTPCNDLDVLANSVGLPFPGVEVRLVTEKGDIAPSGVEGEVQARSKYNMLGYWRRPAETSQTLLPDGWMRTGDLAVQRPDGRYRLVGRLKEMFKSGGYNIYPQEVERAIETHPDVASAAVVARPDPLWQEIGVAFVVPKQPLSAESLRMHCHGVLANYKVPKHFVLRESLPLLPIGKVDKVTLRAWALEIDHA